MPQNDVCRLRIQLIKSRGLLASGLIALTEDSQAYFTTGGVEKHNLLQYQPCIFLQTTLRPQISRAFPEEVNKVFLYFLHAEVEVQRAGPACPKLLPMLGMRATDPRSERPGGMSGCVSWGCPSSETFACGSF